MYDNLLKEQERVGVAFQNQQKQQEDLKKELDESTRGAEELANLIRTKSEAIKTLRTKLVQAKKTKAKLKAEVETLHSDEPQQQQQPQQQQVSSSQHTAWQPSTSGTEQSCKPSEKINAVWPMLSDCHVVPGAPQRFRACSQTKAGRLQRTQPRNLRSRTRVSERAGGSL